MEPTIAFNATSEELEWLISLHAHRYYEAKTMSSGITHSGQTVADADQSIAEDRLQALVETIGPNTVNELLEKAQHDVEDEYEQMLTGFMFGPSWQSIDGILGVLDL